MNAVHHRPNGPWHPDPQPPVPRATFGKHEHLCGTLRIRAVATTGRGVNEHPFKLVGRIMALTEPVSAQVAFAVPKRNLRHAVDRNRMKRLMREAYRLNKAPHMERLAAKGIQVAWLFVFQAQQAVSYAETEQKISRALTRWMEQHG